MTRRLHKQTYAAALLATVALTVCVRAWPSLPEPVVILEATNIIHSWGARTDTTLLVRLRSDGVAEWEENLDAVKRKKHTSRISAGDLALVQRRLNSVDPSTLSGKMGPYATYIDTSVDLQVHAVTGKGALDFTLVNPWESAPEKLKIGGEKVMPETAKTVFCEVSRLRARLSRDSVDAACTASPGK